ncbi:SMI1/KNR4 family protein [Blastopirellula marina]|uniref:Knr4/Smi1-like domain-containing protein n=1 Tax=Blastopirellula marina TaxID=124 RepID=A0A2S8F3D1_9BACT|nr:SMI1/KNR4 family protein [Blastopirellula marina]PQO26659.1 hypothetical protein C5Y98_30225 [Blastopirellula marina]PQO45092.1 hypothetical protein C5Y93_16295 [Blastopirellula marina]PTL40970.1 SMI1/KNR4 family protein [Blastopirellula marina]
MKYVGKFGFQSKYGPCDEAALAAFESTLPEGRLPDEYKAFLREWNGGEFDLELAREGDAYKFIGFSIIGDDFDGDANDAGLVDFLVGLFDPESIDDLRKGSHAHGFRDAVPSSYLSIGRSNLTTSQVCLSVAGPDFGAVYYWGGEPWPDEPSPTTDYLFPVAADFAAFWDRIQIVVQD